MHSLEVFDPRAKDVVVHLCIAKHKSTSMSVQHDHVHALQRHLPSRVSASGLGRDFLCLQRSDPIGRPTISLHHHGSLSGDHDGSQSQGRLIPLIGEHGCGEIDDTDEEVRVERNVIRSTDTEVEGVDHGGDDEEDKEDQTHKRVEDHSDVLEDLWNRHDRNKAI